MMAKNLMETTEFRNLLVLLGYFIVLAIVLYSFRVGQLAWSLLLVSAAAWCGIEVAQNRGRLAKAFAIGAFLLVFDFMFENAGWLLGLWQTKSAVAIGVVPIEVMGIAFFGGAAWALYLPRKFRLDHSIADVLVFAAFGAVGEWLLIRQGLFTYSLWWNSGFAFLAYLGTWIVLHFVRYRIVKG